MERRAEIVEEVIISLKFVCNVEKGKKPAVNTVEYSSDSGESLFTVQLALEIDSAHAQQRFLKDHGSHENKRGS